MSYAPESWDSVDLGLFAGSYAVETDPLALSLDFADAGTNAPPLPWAIPLLNTEYSAPLQRATTSQQVRGLPITPATPADDQRCLLYTSPSPRDRG